MRFLVTEECGRLARWLRLMGHDAELSATQPLTTLYRRTCNEQRVLLTRNRRIGASCVFRVIHLDSVSLQDQLRQLLRDMPEAASAERFSRCDRCNVALQPIDKASVKERVPEFVYQAHETFRTCPSCRRVYWAATHARRVEAVLDQLSR